MATKKKKKATKKPNYITGWLFVESCMNNVDTFRGSRQEIIDAAKVSAGEEGNDVFVLLFSKGDALLIEVEQEPTVKTAPYED